MLETLPLAAPSKPRELSPEELAMLEEKEELTLMELRIFLRDVLNKLGTDKKFSIFAKPVNIEDVCIFYLKDDRFTKSKWIIYFNVTT